MEKSIFLETFCEYLEYKPQFSKLRTILHIELGVRPETGLEEREVIYNVLDETLNLNRYCTMQMKKGDGFYLVNKKFFDNWTSYIKSGSKK